MCKGCHLYVCARLQHLATVRKLTMCRKPTKQMTKHLREAAKTEAKLND